MTTKVIISELKTELNYFICPECGINRIILKDMLHAKGGTRKTNAARRTEAKNIISKCKSCQSHYYGNNSKQSEAQ